MILDTHVILVSVQAVPNLTPLLDESTKPRRVVLLVSPDMQQRADWLEDIIKVKGIKTERWPIDNAFDIEHIRARVETLLNQLPLDRIALNATGGTKPMSIAAYEAFRDLDCPIFYVHPELDRLIWMHPKDRPPHDLADRIKLKPFLQSYGVTVTAQGDQHGVSEAFRELTQTLIRHPDAYSDSLKTLNYLAVQAINSLTAALTDQHLKDPALTRLIDLFVEHDLLSLRQNRLQFADEAARFYVNGGWLEQHVYGICLNLKKDYGIQDIARSLEVERSLCKLPIKNELDVVFLKNNRLYLIECKTHNDKSKADGKNTDALYKLDSLKDLMGGLQAKAMLVSFNRLNDSDRRRADDLRIDVCAGTDLAQLPQKLTDWLK